MECQDITSTRLREVLHYSVVTGEFYWREKIAAKCVVGARAGCRSGRRSVIAIRLFGRSYLAHRLAWFYVNGEWPEQQIDHIDTRPSNNAWINLRDVSPMVNSQNARAARPNSSTGVLGVFRRKRPKPFYAQIMVAGKLKHLGSFSTLAEAEVVYLAAKRSMHEGCTV